MHGKYRDTQRSCRSLLIIQKTSVDENPEVFFTVHDPTSFGIKQGDDAGSAIPVSNFLRGNDQQLNIAKSIIDELK